MRTVLKATFDTNIIVRMVLSSPTTLAGKLLQALRDGAFQLVLSPPLVEEIVETLLSPHLQAKHGWSEAEIRAFVDALVTFSVVTPGLLNPNLPSLKRRDESDLVIVAAALEGEADYIVTQDRDLLDLVDEGVEEPRIVEPPEFYQALHKIIPMKEDS